MSRKHTVAASRTTTTHIVLPGDTNSHGTIFGGKVMQWVDIAASVAATRHCRMPVVTASIDDLHFLHPVKLGHHVIITAEVTSTGHSSMEIEATVYSENPLTAERQLTSVAYLTFVGLTKGGKPAKIPPVIPETSSEIRRFKAAQERKSTRIQRLKSMRQHLRE